MRSHVFRVAALLGAGSLVLAACGGDSGEAAAAESYRFGVIIPLSGAQASYGEMARGGLDIAVEELNAAGGIDGKRIELQYEDNQGLPQTSATAAQKLVGEGVKVIFTHGSSVTAAVTKVTENSDVILPNMAAQTDIVVAHPQVYSFIPTNNMELGHLAELAYTKRGARNLAVIHSDDDYGNSASAAVANAFEELGGEVVAVESHPVGVVDMRTNLIKIRDADPDAVAVLSNTGEIGHIVKQARELNVPGDIMGADSALSPSEYATGGDAYEGMIGVAIRFDPERNEEARAFAETFEDKYGVEPNNYAAISYEAMKLVASAVGDAGSDDPATVGEHLLTVDGVEGTLGTMNFNERRILEFPYYDWHFTGGEITPLD